MELNGIKFRDLLTRVINSTFNTSDDVILIMSENGKGRLTISKQLILQKDLRKYYEKGISAITAAKSADVNVKTACKYFKQWSKEIHELTSKKFQDQIIEAKVQNLLVLDNQLDYLYYLQIQMNDRTTIRAGEHGASYNFNFREKIATTKMILDIIDKRNEILGIQKLD